MTCVCVSAADLTAETLQQQVQAADRSVDALLGVLQGQPAEGSAAGAPGEVPALGGGGKRPGEEGIDPAPVQPLAALTHRVQDEDVSVLQYISCDHLRAAESSSTPYLFTQVHFG